MKRRTKKKALTLFLATTIVVLCFIPFTSVFGRTRITTPSDVSGEDFTNCESLADTVTAIINGDIDLFTNYACTKEFNIPIGNSLNNNKVYCVKSKTTEKVLEGWQCYIYANAVYNRLFGEYVRHAEALKHSEIVITGGKSAVSYEMFKEADVLLGAYVRTTANKNGSYNSEKAHSLVVLGYDEKYITYIEGNADSKGLACVTHETWDEFNEGELQGRSRYICHVVQPVREKYAELYPGSIHLHDYKMTGEAEHPHKEYGICSCGEKKYTGETIELLNCVKCNPVGTPALSLSASKAPVGWRIEASITKAENAKEYTIKYLDGNGTAHSLLTTSYVSEKISFEKAGTHSVFVEALGINGDSRQSTAVPLNVYDPQGSTGSCSWRVNRSELVISGKGAMKDYNDSSSLPWDTNITKAFVESGVTAIGENAFADCNQLKSVSIPKSVATIGSNAFSSCTRLSEVWYEGTADEQEKITIKTPNSALDNAVWHYVDGPCDTECNTCGKKRSAPHVYNNIKDLECNKCGHIRTSYLRGDVDGSEYLDTDDAIYLLFHVNFQNKYPVNQPIDFDNNGKINIEDAIQLLFYCNFPESFPLD